MQLSTQNLNVFCVCEYFIPSWKKDEHFPSYWKEIPQILDIDHWVIELVPCCFFAFVFTKISVIRMYCFCRKVTSSDSSGLIPFESIINPSHRTQGAFFCLQMAPPFPEKPGFLILARWWLCLAPQNSLEGLPVGTLHVSVWTATLSLAGTCLSQDF